MLYIQRVGVFYKISRELNGNVGCIGNLQRVRCYYLFSGSTILGTNNYYIILRGNIKRVGRFIIRLRLYIQISTNFDFFLIRNFVLRCVLILLTQCVAIIA